jgi:hypothetical protein
MIKLNPEVIRWFNDVANDMQHAAEATRFPNAYLGHLVPWPNWKPDPLIVGKVVNQFADMEGTVYEAGVVFDAETHDLQFYVVELGHIEPEETQ